MMPIGANMIGIGIRCPKIVADETKHVSLFRTVTAKELTGQVSDVRIDAGPRDYAPFVEFLPVGRSRNKQ